MPPDKLNGVRPHLIRELIRKDQYRLKLRELLLAGAASPSSGPAHANYFEGLRVRVRKRAKPGARR